MSKKIKMIWDFRGPAANQTAIHHVIHLKEYMQMENIAHYGCESLSESEFSAMAFLIVDEVHVPKLRTALKPHRGQLCE